ncbi:MAG: hypothetical protein R2716_00425 [Microthrixaceae bacterium]
MPELRECLDLDLAYALSGHTEALTHLLEGVGLVVVEAEAHPHDLLLALGELGERR